MQPKKPAPSLTLDALVDSLPEPTILTGEVDVSDLWPDAEGKPQEKGSVIFVYQDPTVEHFFAATKDAEILRKKSPQWTMDQALNVALLAICHKAPATENKRGELYVRIAKNTTLFMRLNDGFNKAFPHLKDIQKAAEEQGKSLSAM